MEAGGPDSDQEPAAEPPEARPAPGGLTPQDPAEEHLQRLKAELMAAKLNKPNEEISAIKKQTWYWQ